ncbi:uncharacterized protein SCHCODRAFT_01110969 [Schizophyllum commune H4-8]|nr:uncharacterized protein SCHCODRAFT_01110969 [Schizophyllum commune H4-8]KAI5897277.1 hypothetical protein SCHCODRAFT_01110969 [Schizophyllum commune H4-8]
MSHSPSNHGSTSGFDIISSPSHHSSDNHAASHTATYRDPPPSEHTDSEHDHPHASSSPSHPSSHRSSHPHVSDSEPDDYPETAPPRDADVDDLTDRFGKAFSDGSPRRTGTSNPQDSHTSQQGSRSHRPTNNSPPKAQFSDQPRGRSDSKPKVLPKGLSTEERRQARQGHFSHSRGTSPESGRERSSSRHGVYELPPLNTRNAPRKFTGKAEDIADFLDHYERLLKRYKVVRDREKCNALLQYCSTQVKRYIKGVREFADHNWAGLKKNLLFYYDAEKADRMYTACDVMEFAYKAREKKIRNLAQWKQYYRRLTRRSGALVNSGEIEEADEAYYLWMGIHPDLQSQMETHIEMKRELRGSDTEDEEEQEPYTNEEISSAARHLFRRNRFVTRRFDADRFGQRPGAESSGSETESDDEGSTDDSDMEKLRRKLKLGRKHKTKKKEAKREKKQLDRVSKMNSPTDLTQLVKQLNEMRPDHEMYAPMYYKALCMDTTHRVEEFIRAKPIFHSEDQARANGLPIAPQASRSNRQPVKSREDRPPRRTEPYGRPPLRNYQDRPPPPHMDESRTYPTPATGANAVPPPPGCYGCGERGHRLSACPTIDQLVRQGKVRRDPYSGRVTLLDGGDVRRTPGESTMAQAIERLTSANVHFFYPDQYDSGSDDDTNARVGMFFAGISTYGIDTSESEADYAIAVNDSHWQSFYHSQHSWEEEEDEFFQENSDDDEQEWLSDEEAHAMHYAPGPAVYNRTFPAKDRAEKENVGTRTRREMMDSGSRRTGLRDPKPPQLIPSKYRDFRMPAGVRKAPPPKPKQPTRPPREIGRTEDVEMGPPAPLEPNSADPKPASAPDQPPQEEGPRLNSSKPFAQPSSRPESQHHPTEAGSPPPPRRAVQRDPYKTSPPVIPVDARQPRVHFPADEARERVTRLEPERPLREIRPNREKSDERHAPDQPKVRVRGPARIAPISEGVSAKSFVDNILEQAVTLPIGQVIGVASKDVQVEFHERLKPRSVSKPSTSNLVEYEEQHVSSVDAFEAAVDTYALNPGDDALITLKVICEGREIIAIVDTGSQLNVMRGELAEDLFLPHRPIDLAGAIVMNDANGGEARLRGLVSEVDLQLADSDILTVADIHIGKRSRPDRPVGYDLLLGRPWQRQNLISIDERPDGTYLEVRDPNDGHKRYEFRVQRRPDVSAALRRQLAPLHDRRLAPKQRPAQERFAKQGTNTYLRQASCLAVVAEPLSTDGVKKEIVSNGERSSPSRSNQVAYTRPNKRARAFSTDSIISGIALGIASLIQYIQCPLGITFCLGLVSPLPSTYPRDFRKAMKYKSKMFAPGLLSRIHGVPSIFLLIVCTLLLHMHNGYLRSRAEAMADPQRELRQQLRATLPSIENYYLFNCAGFDGPHVSPFLVQRHPSVNGDRAFGAWPRVCPVPQGLTPYQTLHAAADLAFDVADHAPPDESMYHPVSLSGMGMPITIDKRDEHGNVSTQLVWHNACLSGYDEGTRSTYTRVGHAICHFFDDHAPGNYVFPVATVQPPYFKRITAAGRNLHVYEPSVFQPPTGTVVSYFASAETDVPDAPSRRGPIPFFLRNHPQYLKHFHQRLGDELVRRFLDERTTIQYPRACRIGTDTGLDEDSDDEEPRFIACPPRELGPDVSDWLVEDAFEPTSPTSPLSNSGDVRMSARTEDRDADRDDEDEEVDDGDDDEDDGGTQHAEEGTPDDASGITSLSYASSDSSSPDPLALPSTVKTDAEEIIEPDEERPSRMTRASRSQRTSKWVGHYTFGETALLADSRADIVEMPLGNRDAQVLLLTTRDARANTPHPFFKNGVKRALPVVLDKRPCEDELRPDFTVAGGLSSGADSSSREPANGAATPDDLAYPSDSSSASFSPFHIAPPTSASDISPYDTPLCPPCLKNLHPGDVYKGCPDPIEHRARAKATIGGEISMGYDSDSESIPGLCLSPPAIYSSLPPQLRRAQSLPAIAVHCPTSPSSSELSSIVFANPDTGDDHRLYVHATRSPSNDSIDYETSAFRPPSRASTPPSSTSSSMPPLQEDRHWYPRPNKSSMEDVWHDLRRIGTTIDLMHSLEDAIGLLIARRQMASRLTGEERARELKAVIAVVEKRLLDMIDLNEDEIIPDDFGQPPYEVMVQFRSSLQRARLAICDLLMHEIHQDDTLVSEGWHQIDLAPPSMLNEFRSRCVTNEDRLLHEWYHLSLPHLPEDIGGVPPELSYATRDEFIEISEKHRDYALPPPIREVAPPSLAGPITDALDKVQLPATFNPFLYQEEALFLLAFADAITGYRMQTSRSNYSTILITEPDDTRALVARELPHTGYLVRGWLRVGYLGGPHRLASSFARARVEQQRGPQRL